MSPRALRCWTACLLCGVLAACQDAPPPPTTTVTANGAAPATQPGGEPAAPAISPPPLPANVKAQLAPTGGGTALALWVQEGVVMASSYTPQRAWAPAQPLEQIYGGASEPQLASDGKGYGMAVWQHTVGKIHSLRFSRYEAGTGWSVPDVVPGALPRPPGQAVPPQLRMDAAGHAYARWPSGFDENEMQAARFVAGQGWGRVVSEPTSASLRSEAAVNGG